MGTGRLFHAGHREMAVYRTQQNLSAVPGTGRCRAYRERRVVCRGGSNAWGMRDGCRGRTGRGSALSALCHGSEIAPSVDKVIRVNARLFERTPQCALGKLPVHRNDTSLVISAQDDMAASPTYRRESKLTKDAQSLCARDQRQLRHVPLPRMW